MITAPSIKTKTAVGKKSLKKLYHRNLTTLGFMRLLPLFYRELIPDEKIKGSYQIWSRTNPLVLPTMGLTEYHINKFFVRYKDIWAPFDDWYNNSYHVGANGQAGIVSRLPYFTMQEFIRTFLALGYIIADASRYDVTVRVSQGTTAYYRFTDKGYYLMNVLQSLGYELSWNYEDNKRYELLTFMAFGKIYMDYYFPHQYTLYTKYVTAQKCFTLDEIDYSPNNTVFRDGIRALIELICDGVYYDNDSFYQGWDSPAAPSQSSSYSSIAVKDTTVNDEHANAVYSTPDGTTFLGEDAGSVSAVSGGITKFGLVALQRVSDLVKRFQLSGNEAVRRFFARFGIPLTDSHMAIRCGSESSIVSIGDVESNSNSNVNISGTDHNSVLGDLAGKAVNACQGNVEYKNDSHFGMYFVLISIVPDGGLYSGCDRLHFQSLYNEKYNGELDSLGCTSVDLQEVMTSYNGIQNASQGASPFCFLPNQYEYCVGKNILSGAFRWNSLGGNVLAPYHLYRNPSRLQDTENVVVHSLAFMSSFDKDQFNRIFYNQNDMNPFIIRFRCSYDSISSKKSLSESYQWSDNDGSYVQVDGNSVSQN